MSKFRDMVARFDRKTFLDLNAFGEVRTLVYSGEVFPDVAVVLERPTHKTRLKRVAEYVEGVYRSQLTLRCMMEDIGGELPKEGEKVRISDPSSSTLYYQDYYVKSATCEYGFLTLYLGGNDE